MIVVELNLREIKQAWLNGISERYVGLNYHGRIEFA